MLESLLRRVPPLPRLPAVVSAEVFAAGFNQFIRGQRIERRLAELEGKRFRLRATDMPWAIEVRVAGARLRATRDALPPHVQISGSLADFWRLARRSEDPDTLFFHRRLSMEGETETALLVKNLLDALDWDFDAHAQAVLPTPLARAAIGAHRRVRRVLAGRY